MRKFRRPLIWTALVLAVVFVAGFLLPVNITRNHSGIGGKLAVTVGSSASASSVADFVTDGMDDNIQFQAALNALSVTGGKLEVFSGNYSFSATVSRAINNVTIEGYGGSSYFHYDGSHALFSAGTQSNWVFVGIKTDAGGIAVGSSTNWLMINVTEGNTFYSFASPQQASSPTGRSADIIIAPSNSPNKAQADYVLPGSNDYLVWNQVMLKASNTFVGRTGQVRITVLAGDIYPGVDRQLKIYSGEHIWGQGADLTFIHSQMSSDIGVLVSGNTTIALNDIELAYMGIEGDEDSITQSGIYLRGVYGSLIHDMAINSIKGTGYHTSAAGDGSLSMQNKVFRVGFSNVASPVKIEDVGWGATVFDDLFIPTSGSGGGYGIEISPDVANSVGYVDIRHNIFQGFGGTAIYATNAKNLVISNNDLATVGFKTANTYSAISVTGASPNPIIRDNNIIVDNVVSSVWSGNDTPKYAINIGGSGVTNGVVQDNIITVGTNGTIGTSFFLDNGTGTKWVGNTTP